MVAAEPLPIFWYKTGQHLCAHFYFVNYIPVDTVAEYSPYERDPPALRGKCCIPQAKLPRLSWHGPSVPPNPFNWDSD
jgi:hypothetical protein